MRTSNHPRRTVLATTLIALLTVTSLDAQVFELTELGTLEPPPNLPNSATSKAFDVNDFGHVVGRSRGDDLELHLVRYRGPETGLEDLGPLIATSPGGRSIPPSISSAYINNFGVIAGTAGVLLSTRTAFRRTEEGFFILDDGDPTTNRFTSGVTGINNNGQVIGFTFPDSPSRADPRRGSLWQPDGTEVELPLATGEPFIGIPFGLSDDTRIVSGGLGWGQIEQPAFYWDGGAPLSIPELGGALSQNRPAAVNNSGLVVGQVRTEIDVFQGYLWSVEDGLVVVPPGEMPPSRTVTDGLGPVDINNSGQVVGNDRTRPYLYLTEPGLGLAPGRHDLPSLIFPRPRGRMIATAISNAGHICGYFDVSRGSSDFGRAFLLTPKMLNPVDPFADLAMTSANYLWSAEYGDPVNTLTGEFVHFPPPDLTLDGPRPLAFRRYLGTFLHRDRKIAGRLGDNWLHNFEWRLHRHENGDRIVVIGDEGQIIRFERSADSTWTLTRSPGTPFQLVERGDRWVLADPAEELIYTFDLAGKLTRTEDRNGNPHVLSYDGELLTSVTDGLGRTLGFAYDEAGYLASVSDGTRTVEFSYSRTPFSRGLSCVTDAAGDSWCYRPRILDVDHGFLPTDLSTRDADLELTYDAAGRVIEQEDGESEVTTFSYDDDLTTMTDPLGGIEVHAHTPSGELTSITDAAERTRAATSNADGRRNAITASTGTTAQLTYHDGTGRIQSVTYPDGGTVTYTYELDESDGLRFWDIVEASYPDGTTDRFEYDGSGNIVTATDRAGRSGTFTYNERGQLLTSTTPIGGTTTSSYDDAGRLVSVTDPRGNTTTFQHDVLGRRTGTTHPDGSTRTREFDVLDRIVSVTDELDSATTFSYDFRGNLESFTDALGNTVSLDYDRENRLESVRDAAGAFAFVNFDGRGRIEESFDANGNATSYAYDLADNVTTVTDPEGHVWTRAYDGAGRLTSAVNPLGGTVVYEHDATGRPTVTTSPSGHPSSLGLDIRGRVTSIQEGSRPTLEWSRDVMGKLSRVSLDGVDVTLERDAVGNITRITGPRGGVWERTYDASGAMRTVTDPLGRTTTHDHDSRGRLERITTPEGSLAISYDSAGKTVRQDCSDGTSIDFEYDAAGRLTGATGVTATLDARGAAIESNGIANEYDPGGRLVAVTLTPDRRITYAYDRRDLLVEVTDWLGGTTTFTHDAAGRLVETVRPNGVTTTLEYDADNRVVDIVETRGESTLARQSLTRDLEGNVVSASRDVPQEPEAAPEAVTHSFDAAYQVEGFEYDGEGRVVADDRRSYTWDGASRLTGHVESGEAVRLAHDAFGNVIERTVSGTTRQLVWNYATGRPSLAVEREGDTELRFWVRSPDGALLYSIDANGARSFFHFDEIGSTRFLTDEAGAIVQAYAYGPHGAILGFTDGGIENPFTYVGRHGVRQEGQTGLYVMSQRVYDSRTRRFLSRDPVGNQFHPQLVNPYQYGAQNPLRFIDASGLQAVEPRVNGGSKDRATTTSSSSFLLNIAVAVTPYASAASFFVDGLTNGFPVNAGAGRFSLSLNPWGPQAKKSNLVTALLRDSFVAFGLNVESAKNQALLSSSIRSQARRQTWLKYAEGLGKWADRVFTAATIFSATLGTISGISNLRRAGNDARRADVLSAETQATQLVAGLEALADKSITPAQHRRLVARINRDFRVRDNASHGTATLLGVVTVERRNVGTLLESAIFMKNMLASPLPFSLDWVGAGDPVRSTLDGVVK